MHRSIRIAVAAFAGVLATLAGPTFAQSLEELAEVDSGGCHCFVGKPYPRCCDFWLVEIGPGITVASSGDWLESGTTMLAADFGFMKNLNEGSGVGITVYGATDNRHSRAGVRLRYRRWLSSKTALDLSPGLLVVGGDNGPYAFDIKYPSFMATASVTYASRISAFVGMECLRTNDRYDYIMDLPGRGKGVSTVFWAGAGGGAELGVAGLAALLALLAVAAATY